MKAKIFALCLLIGGAGYFQPIELFSQNIDIDRARAQESFRLGVQAFHHGYLQESVLYLQKALSLKPEEELPRRWLGRALYRTGLEEAALREWRSLLEGGRGDSLLRDTVKRIELRRGLGPELLDPRDRTYVLAQELAGRSSGADIFQRPTSVRLGADGSARIVSFAGNEIVRVDVNNDVLETWHGGLSGFDRPYDVLEAGPYVFVSEYGANRIARLSARGQRQMVFGRTGSGPGQLLGPQYLATDGRGHVYVTDWGNRRINKYDFEGNFLLSFGGPKRLTGPTGIAVSGEEVFVADRPGARIEVFDLSGNHLRTCGQGFLSAPEGMVFADDKTLLAADARRIVELDLERETWRVRGDLSSAARRLSSVGLSPNGEIYAVDFDLSRLFILTETAALVSGLHVQVERVHSDSFPTVQVSVSVQDRAGRPVVGLDDRNFRITEAHRPTGGVNLIQKVPPGLEVALLIDPSLSPQRHGAALREAVAALYDGLAGRGSLRVISAGELPAIEAGERSTRLEILAAAQRAAGAEEAGRSAAPQSLEDSGLRPSGTQTSSGRLDLAVRLAAAHLVPVPAQRAIVYLTAGRLGRDAFREYSPGEAARYLANNAIAFHAVTFDAPPAAAELTFLSGETGGSVHSWLAPAGLNPLVRALDGLRRPLYTLEYTSTSPGRFGESYIPLEVQVVLARGSGRDELGYYAPRSSR